MDHFAAAQALAPEVDKLRGAFDQERSLPLSLVDAMGEAGLFGLWQPRALGGPEVAPTALLKVAEELARQDASVGWCAVISAGYSRLAGAMEEGVARTVFGTGRGVLVGSLNPSGKAIAVSGGYRVSGRWSYGSFIGYGDWVLGNCLIEDASGPLAATDGGPAFRLCLFPGHVVDVFDTWHVGGLRATGSNDYAVTDLFVQEALSIPFSGFNPPPVQPGPLYRIPLPSTFVSCIAAVMLGTARGAIEALVQIAGSKTIAGALGPVLRDKPMTQVELARAEALLRAGRAFLFNELETMWDDAQAGRLISIESRAQVRLAAVHAGQCAIQATDLMYQLAGGAALLQGGRLERCFRDIHAAGQHIAMSPQAYLEPIGRVFLGLPPGTTRF